MQEDYTLQPSDLTAHDNRMPKAARVEDIDAFLRDAAALERLKAQTKQIDHMFFDEFNTMPPEFFHKLTNRTDVRWPPSGATEYLSTEPRELPE